MTSNMAATWVFVFFWILNSFNFEKNGTANDTKTPQISTCHAGQVLSKSTCPHLPTKGFDEEDKY